MICIKCGGVIIPKRIDDLPFTGIIGYKCNSCGIDWTKDQHIDDMSYCIQTVNQLKLENDQLKAEIEYFNITFPCYVDAINELKARIEILEQNL